jgi:SAM-dependent methyltransferase
MRARIQRTDYDAIAHLYDEPLRDHDVDPNLLTFLAERPSLVPATARILDVGCGTGKQVAANRTALPEATLVGLDLFAGMLAIAQERCPEAAWVQGDGAALPFPDRSFDYLTNQFSYAHVQHKEGFFREVCRVLRPGGRFVLTNIDPWTMPDWIIYRFFPAARERDDRDFWPAERIEAVMEAAGFVGVEVTRVHQTRQEDLAEFLALARQRHRTSQFMALPDAEYEAGLGRIEGAIDRAGKRPAKVLSEFCLITVRGDKEAA